METEAKENVKMIDFRILNRLRKSIINRMGLLRKGMLSPSIQPNPYRS
jgi:hypothetical protein